MGEIPNLDSPLVVTINPLHIPTHNGVQHEVYTKKMDKYATKHCLIMRSGLSGSTQAWYLSQTSFGHISTKYSTIPTVSKPA